MGPDADRLTRVNGIPIHRLVVIRVADGVVEVEAVPHAVGVVAAAVASALNRDIRSPTALRV